MERRSTAGKGAGKPDAWSVVFRMGSLVPNRMHVVAWLLALGLSGLSVAHGVEDERRKPKEPEKPAAPDVEIKKPEPEQTEAEKNKDAEKTLVEALIGLRLVGRTEDVIPKDAKVSGIDTSSVPMLESEELHQKLSEFLGKPISLKAIRGMAKEVILHCRAHDRPFVNISVPEQDITGGVVQLLVVEAKVGEVRVEGNRFWRTAQYRKGVTLQPGDSVSEQKLIEELNYFNENAFRQVKPIFKPGKEPNTTDLVLKAEERFPVRFYGGYEDTGTQSTGLDRMLVGFNWGNAFMHGHEIGYQFAADIDVERLLSHSGYWRIPLPNKHSLAFSGGYSTIQAPLNEDIDNGGFNWQASMRYIAPLNKLGRYRHEVQIGFDFKQTNNNLDFGGEAIFDSTIDIAQFAFQYSGSYPDAWGRTSFSVGGYASPGHLTSRNTSHEYNVARPGTDPQYAYGELSFERAWRLPKEILLVQRFQGQLATGRLESTEQFLVGGYNSVRGYDDRLVSGDQGFVASVELRSPNFLLGTVNGDPQYENRLQFIAFYDFGRVHNHGRLVGEAKRTDLESVGAGLRYRLGNHVNVRFDYGRQLRRIDGNTEGGDHGRVHLGVVVSY